MCGKLQLSSSERLSTAEAVKRLLPEIRVPWSGFSKNERFEYWAPRVIKGFWCRIQGFAERGSDSHEYWFVGDGLIRIVHVRAHPRTYEFHHSETELRVVTRAASRLVKPIHSREPVIRWTKLPRMLSGHWYQQQPLQFAK